MRATTEDTINGLACRQGGYVTRPQLVEAGLSNRTILRRSQVGLLIVAGVRTYRVGSVPESAGGAVTAACLDLDGVASHRTAAWLHGLWPHPKTLEITLSRRRSLQAPNPTAGERRMPLRLRHSTNLPEEDTVQVGPTPVTSVARTMLGLAALVPREVAQSRLVETVSKAVDLGAATDPWLWWLLSARRCRGRNGVIALEEALAERARLGPTESWLERHVLGVIEQAGLPLPSTQRVIRRSGRFAARVDFLYEPTWVVVEALGYAFHRTREQLDADTRRANELQLAGYDVYQFTSRQITASPEAMISTLRAALEVRRAS